MSTEHTQLTYWHSLVALVPRIGWNLVKEISVDFKEELYLNFLLATFISHILEERFVYFPMFRMRDEHKDNVWQYSLMNI